MKFIIKSTIISICLLSSFDIKNTNAYLPAQNGFTRTITVKPLNRRQYGFSRTNVAIRMSDSSKQEGQDDEIERLRSMAAKLRAEASILEVRFSCAKFWTLYIFNILHALTLFIVVTFRIRHYHFLNNIHRKKLEYNNYIIW